MAKTMVKINKKPKEMFNTVHIMDQLGISRLFSNKHDMI